MEKQGCKNVIEALGRVGSRQIIRNQLNRVLAHTDDPRLKQLIEDVLRDFDQTSTNPDHTPIKNMNSCRSSALLLRQHCESVLAGE